MNAHLAAAVLLALAVILVVARLAGAFARRIGQPAVVGEIAVGLAMGPSLLGLLPGDLPTVVFPDETRPVLYTAAQLGLVLFMFLVGLEVDTSLLRGQAKIATSISLGSIALPFALGVPLALFLWRDHATAPGLLPFTLFIGASLSITAFPVLARVLAERRMDRTPLGALALATASLDDVIAWSLLALVVALVVGGGLLGAGAVVGGTVVFMLILALVVRPLATRALRGTSELSAGRFAVVLAGLLLAAWCTDRIGVHLVFGAFAFGVFFPADPDLREKVAHRIEAVTILLLPVFFVVTGLEVDLAALGVSAFATLALILLAAVVGKVGGAYLAARAFRLDQRRSLAIGVLANTRGLTELVILGIGRELGVLDDALFGLLVVMALVTTAMAGPLLDVVYPKRLVERDLRAGERAAAGAVSVLAALPAAEAGPGGAGQGDDHRRDAGPPANWGAALHVAEALAGSARAGHIMMSRVLPEHHGLGAVAEELSRVSLAGRGVASPTVEVTENVVRGADAAALTADQAARIGADWLVGSAELGTSGADGSRSSADLVVIDPGPEPGPGPVLLASAEPVAWEVAVRLAQARRSPLQVAVSSRARHLIDLARRCGVAASSSTLADPAVVVTGLGEAALAVVPGEAAGATAGPMLVRVVTGQNRAGQNLAERAATIPAVFAPDLEAEGFAVSAANRSTPNRESSR